MFEIHKGMMVYITTGPYRTQYGTVLQKQKIRNPDTGDNEFRFLVEHHQDRTTKEYVNDDILGVE